MLIYERKILKESGQEREKASIVLDGGRLRVALAARDGDNADAPLAEDTLDLAGNGYSSFYFVVIRKFGRVKGQFVRIHPFTFAAKAPLNVFDDLLLGEHVDVYFQVDLGNLAAGDEKLAVQTLRIPAGSIETRGFAACEVVSHDGSVTPRKAVWDRYAIQVAGQTAGCDNKGSLLMGVLPVLKADGDYLEVAVQKYTPGFEAPLTRAEDNETVFIETTAGALNTSRVQLENGTGKFRLYPLGYTGPLKIKLGWRYFSGWSEYPLKLEA